MDLRDLKLVLQRTKDLGDDATLHEIQRLLSRWGYGNAQDRKPLLKRGSISGRPNEHKVACSDCRKTIRRPEYGVIVEGNIYVACLDNDGLPRGGLIGDKTSNRISAFCGPCFRALVPEHFHLEGNVYEENENVGLLYV